MPPVFSIIPSTAEVENASGSVEVSISNPGGDWTATTTSDWVTVSPTTGYGSSVVTISYGENLGNIERTGIMTVETEFGWTAVFTLTQAGKVASSGNIFVGDNNVYVMLGDSEIAAIYAGEELIYPFNLGTLTGITIENITWDTDVPASGGTATEENCSYKVVAHYDSGKSRTVTSKATVTGSLAVPATTAETREMVGVLQLTATYEEFTATGSVDVYQSSVGPIPSDYQELQYIIEPPATWAYIPTDIYMTSDMWFEYKVRPTQNPSVPEKYIFSGSYYQPMRVLANNTMRVRRGQTSSSNPTANVYQWGSDTTFVEFKGNDDVIVNGTKIYTLAAGATTTDTHKGYFFSSLETVPGTIPGSSGNEFSMVGWLYYFIIGSNTTGQELYHFVPVKRLSDDEVGLYEIVNGQFYGPGNNKKFTAGPAVEE